MSDSDEYLYSFSINVYKHHYIDVIGIYDSKLDLIEFIKSFHIKNSNICKIYGYNFVDVDKLIQFMESIPYNCSYMSTNFLIKSIFGELYYVGGEIKRFPITKKMISRKIDILNMKKNSWINT